MKEKIEQKVAEVKAELEKYSGDRNVCCSQCGSFCAYDCYGCNRPEEETRYVKGLKTQLKTYQELLEENKKGEK